LKTIIVNSAREKTYTINLVKELPEDGSKTVEIKNTGMSSTAKQRRLQWLWAGEVARSGLGQDDNKEAVHVRAKWMFARPILLRDNELFGILYNAFMDLVKDSIAFPELCRQFTAQHISTERMTKRQRSEYLSEFERYWTCKGVQLTSPDLLGLGLKTIGGC